MAELRQVNARAPLLRLCCFQVQPRCIYLCSDMHLRVHLTYFVCAILCCSVGCFMDHLKSGISPASVCLVTGILGLGISFYASLFCRPKEDPSLRDMVNAFEEHGLTTEHLRTLRCVVYVFCFCFLCLLWFFDDFSAFVSLYYDTPRHCGYVVSSCDWIFMAFHILAFCV